MYTPPNWRRLPPGATVLPPGATVLPSGAPIPLSMPPYRVYEGEPRYAGYPTPPAAGYHSIPHASRVFDSPGVTSYSDYEGRRSKHSKSSSGKKHKRQDKERSTLSEWKNWRTSINEDLSRDILRHSYQDIPVGDDFEKLKRSSKHHGKSVYHYSTAEDQATRLAKDDYINFGIPRATASGQGSSSEESDGDSKPFYSIKKLNGFSQRDPSPGRHRYSGEEANRSRNYREARHEYRSPLNARDERYFSPR